MLRQRLDRLTTLFTLVAVVAAVASSPIERKPKPAITSSQVALPAAPKTSCVLVEHKFGERALVCCDDAGCSVTLVRSDLINSGATISAGNDEKN
jgi:hypothetical protein